MQYGKSRKAVRPCALPFFVDRKRDDVHQHPASSKRQVASSCANARVFSAHAAPLLCESARLMCGLSFITGPPFVSQQSWGAEFLPASRACHSAPTSTGMKLALKRRAQTHSLTHTSLGSTSPGASPALSSAVSQQPAVGHRRRQPNSLRPACLSLTRHSSPFFKRNS